MTNANSYMQMAMMNPQFAAAFQQQQQQQQTSPVAGGAPFPGAVGFNYPPGYYQQPQQYTPVKLDGMNSVSINKGSASGKTTGTRTSRKRKTDAERAARVCVNCQCTSSPFWRKEKNGEGSLCNACGLYFAKNNSPRPVGLWKRERNGNTLAVKEARLQQQQQEQLAAQQQQQQNGDKKGAPATSVPPNNNTSEEGGDKQQQNDSGSSRQNQKTASNEAGSDGTKTESVEKANQSGGNSSDENNEKKGASEENTDDENENENKSEVKRAKVVLETRGERVVVRVSESVERVLRECEEE